MKNKIVILLLRIFGLLTFVIITFRPVCPSVFFASFVSNFGVHTRTDPFI